MFFIGITEPPHPTRQLVATTSIPRHMQVYHRRHAVAIRKTPPSYQPAVRKPRHDATQIRAARLCDRQRGVQVPAGDNDGCKDDADDASDTRPTTTMVTNARLTTSWASAQCIMMSFSSFLCCFTSFLTDSHPVAPAHVGVHPAPHSSSFKLQVHHYYPATDVTPSRHARPTTILTYPDPTPNVVRKTRNPFPTRPMTPSKHGEQDPINPQGHRLDDSRGAGSAAVTR
ncbi:hypothetical protein EDB87DRAFT_1756405 [Lactarius vividus]|nr:hypothetical protein EDB87DRAFT_1756405 [Lactarius vividus]